MSTPVSGFHNNLHNISQVLQDLFAGLLRASGLAVYKSGRMANNGRCSQTWPSISIEERGEMTSYLMNCFAKERYSIERTNAWIDSYRSTLNRLDTTQTTSLEV